MNRGIVQTRLITTTFITNLQNTRHVGQFKVSQVVKLGCATRKLWGMVNVDTRGKLFPATIGRCWKQETGTGNLLNSRWRTSSQMVYIHRRRNSTQLNSLHVWWWKEVCQTETKACMSHHSEALLYFQLPRVQRTHRVLAINIHFHLSVQYTVIRNCYDNLNIAWQRHHVQYLLANKLSSIDFLP